MIELLGWVFLSFLFLLIGYPVYKHRWPEGLWSADDDNEKLERVRRVGRRRVLPRPLGLARGEHHNHRHPERFQ